MRGRRPLFLQLGLALVGAAALYTGFTLPPKSVRLPASPSSKPVVYGGYHVHSARSDGTGTPDEIAAAAARAGLQFVILTDHGDATRPPDPPQYRHGVLVIDAAEVNTNAGHVVALGLPQPAPYPLAGEARDVIDDIHRLGGWAVVAHPDSPRTELSWRAWNVPFDGLEWLNADSEWRDEVPLRVAGAFARYLVRSPETIASLFQRPARTLQRWDTTSSRRPIVGLAALDTHARLGWSDDNDATRGRTLIARPNYQELFRTLTQAAVLDGPLTNDASSDATTLLEVLRRGRTFSVINAMAAPGVLDFRAERRDAGAGIGDSLTESNEPTRVVAAVAGVPLARVVVMRNGSAFHSGNGSVDFTAPLAQGAYRVEVFYPGRAMPWIVSNPIYVGQSPAGPGQTAGPPVPPPVRMVDLPGMDGWNVESDPSSTGKPTIEGRSVTFAYSLRAGPPAGQFAAVVTSLDDSLKDQGFDRVAFTVRSDRPMRFSVQLRLPASKEGQRWRHSVYADSTSRSYVLNLQDFVPVEATSNRPVVAHIKTVLFVVDTVNTSPGTKGMIWLSGVSLGVGSTERGQGS